MIRFSLPEVLRALEQEQGMPQALYADAAQVARKTVMENPDYA